MVRTRMNREERAKQFMPFSPLKGYEEALREKERTIVPRLWSIRPLRGRGNVPAETVCGDPPENEAMYGIQDERQ